MEIIVTSANETTTLELAGRFDFSSHKQFREAAANAIAETDTCRIEVDMARVLYLDSSALGMLLNLREKAKSANKEVILANCESTVKQVLTIASFGKLFKIR